MNSLKTLIENHSRGTTINLGAHGYSETGFTRDIWPRMFSFSDKNIDFDILFRESSGLVRYRYKFNVGQVRYQSRFSKPMTLSRASSAVGRTTTKYGSWDARYNTTLRSVDNMSFGKTAKYNKLLSSNPEEIKGTWGRYGIKFGIGEIDIFSIAVDRVTPKIIEAQVWNDMIPEVTASALEKSVPAKIKERYKSRNKGIWPPLSDNWRRRKRHDGYDIRPLHMHDTKPEMISRPPLSTVVDEVGRFIKAKPGPNATVITGIDEAFEKTPFVWLHETGTSVYPARPFIADGVEEGIMDATNWVQQRNPTRSPYKDEMVYTLIDKKLNIRRMSLKGTASATSSVVSSIPGASRIAGMSFEASYTSSLSKSISKLGRYLWWFMPPSQYWAYLGIASEIEGILRGHLLTGDSIQAFISAYLRGVASGMTGVPLSEKFARRRFRYTLYPRRS